jgi:hypothetical protein
VSSSRRLTPHLWLPAPNSSLSGPTQARNVQTRRQSCYGRDGLLQRSRRGLLCWRHICSYVERRSLQKLATTGPWRYCNGDGFVAFSLLFITDPNSSREGIHSRSDDAPAHPSVFHHAGYEWRVEQIDHRRIVAITYFKTVSSRPLVFFAMVQFSQGCHEYFVVKTTKNCDLLDMQHGSPPFGRTSLV